VKTTMMLDVRLLKLYHNVTDRQIERQTDRQGSRWHRCIPKVTKYDCLLSIFGWRFFTLSFHTIVQQPTFTTTITSRRWLVRDQLSFSKEKSSSSSCNTIDHC